MRTYHLHEALSHVKNDNIAPCRDLRHTVVFALNHAEVLDVVSSSKGNDTQTQIKARIERIP